MGQYTWELQRRAMPLSLHFEYPECPPYASPAILRPPAAALVSLRASSWACIHPASSSDADKQVLQPNLWGEPNLQELLRSLDYSFACWSDSGFQAGVLVSLPNHTALRHSHGWPPPPRPAGLTAHSLQSLSFLEGFNNGPHKRAGDTSVLGGFLQQIQVT